MPTTYDPQAAAKSGRFVARIGLVIFVLILLAWAVSKTYQTIPPGHVGVAVLFGKIQERPYREGLHFPINPLYSWHVFDGRQKSHKETAAVPSQDQMTTDLDVSVQYRLIAEQAPMMLRETGTAEDVIEVHLVPRLRSVLREQGKSVRRAEDFFMEEIQQKLQVALKIELQESLRTKGIEVADVLIRDIRLPPFIRQAIEQKKEREQAAERQKAELDRFKTEQQQKIAQAEAERMAAEQEAEKRKLLADAQAYEIEKINKAVSTNPAYIQLQALDALKHISKDPAAKIYFVNGDSPKPLPLMHMGRDEK